MIDLGCGLYAGAAYTAISKTFSIHFVGCGLYTGAPYIPEITVHQSVEIYITLSLFPTLQLHQAAHQGKGPSRSDNEFTHLGVLVLLLCNLLLEVFQLLGLVLQVFLKLGRFTLWRRGRQRGFFLHWHQLCF